MSFRARFNYSLFSISTYIYSLLNIFRPWSRNESLAFYHRLERRNIRGLAAWCWRFPIHNIRIFLNFFVDRLPSPEGRPLYHLYSERLAEHESLKYIPALVIVAYDTQNCRNSMWTLLAFIPLFRLLYHMHNNGLSRLHKKKTGFWIVYDGPKSGRQSNHFWIGCKPRINIENWIDIFQTVSINRNIL